MPKILNLKNLSITLISLAATLSLGFSWYGAGVLVESPVDQRYDPCDELPEPSRFCTTNLLETYNLSNVAVPVQLKSFDNTELKGFYFPSRNHAAIIVQHGYGGQRGTVLHIANMLYQKGYGVITMDLRAHGKSGGEIVTFGRDEAKDMQYAYDYLSERPEIDPEKIGLYGWSLGGATVLLHGSYNHKVKAVVADSPFDAINDQNMQEFTDTIWPLPTLLRIASSFKSGVDFDKNAPINNLDAYQDTPLFLLLPGADTKVDPKSGERLLARLNNPKVKVWREKSFGHVRFSFDAPEKFAKEVGGFFDQYLKPDRINEEPLRGL